MNVEEFTSGLIGSRSGAPFLFIGSGFSRRYLGLEDWSDLLRRFCEDVGEYDYYFATADGNLPKVASLIANDFHHVWWKEEKYSNSRDAFKDQKSGMHSALKNEISLYLESLEIDFTEKEDQIVSEIEMLSALNVDGIITTNWDKLLESIYPEYRVFTGQDELLFANPQSVAEIYKIHGSCDKPDSLVLTAEDYENFEKKNPYLAAKLITIFIEHPIIFIGYSINDPHISSLIFSIASCLGDDKLNRFSENLIFLQRSKGESASQQKVNFNRDGKTISATLIKTDEFIDVYKGISAVKRKIPARILRYCKEQMFELVRSESPEAKMAVLDIDDIGDRDDVEFVVGVGVAAKIGAVEGGLDDNEIGVSGYVGLDRRDLFRNVVTGGGDLDADKILRSTLERACRSNSTFNPIYKFLAEVGIDSESALQKSEYDFAKAVFAKMKNKSLLPSEQYRSTFEKYHAGKEPQEIVDKVGSQKAAIYLAFVDFEGEKLDWLQEYLVNNIDKGFSDPYSTAFIKLMCLYDKLRYGFPEVTSVGSDGAIESLLGGDP